MNTRSEKYARFLLATVIIGLFLMIAAARWMDQTDTIEIHASLPEEGGWSIDNLTVQAGEPLYLRLVSDDVLHGFAIGQDDRYKLELEPGKPIGATLVFDEPGKYVYYCTRWCGPNHWRMRGTIEVLGQSEEVDIQPPLYVKLGLDIDAEHHAEIIPTGKPSADRGEALQIDVPTKYRSLDYYQTHSPVDAWLQMRSDPKLSRLNDVQIWDLIAYIWSSQVTSDGLAEGKLLYAANCAACHGETGKGDGVMAEKISNDLNLDTNSDSHANDDHDEQTNDHNSVTPTDFTDAEHLLGANPAILYGKIIRGGMGTGMPYWGPIFTDEQIWHLVSYLWTFQFQF